MGIGIHTLEFVGRDDVGGGAVALRFAPRRPLVRTAGQHGLWQIPGGGVAPFTIASAPEEQHVVLATRAGTHSRLKRALTALQPGARVRVGGPLSSFTLDGAGDDVVLLAQGIGITPFRAMLAHVALTGTGVRSRLVHVDSVGGHPYRADTASTATEASYPQDRDAFTENLDAAHTDRPGATWFVAGSRSFVSTTSATLRAHGVPPGRVRRDAFYGWSGSPARTAA